jgi:hypothetical protein
VIFDDPQVFANVNTPEELKNLKKYLLHESLSKSTYSFDFIAAC